MRVSVRHLSSGLAQTKGVIEFAAGKQPAIGRDLRSVELQLEAAVKCQPKNASVLHSPQLPFEAPSVACIVLRIILELIGINLARYERDECDFHH